MEKMSDNYVGDNDMTLKERLEKYKKVIFLLELAGLLHDIGKIDSRFIDYRKKWQDRLDGWNLSNDPHDDEEKYYFDHDPLLKKDKFKELNIVLAKGLEELCGCNELQFNKLEIDLHIPFKEIIHLHTRAEGNHIASFLKLGDIIDSAYDRNNPLLSAEQKESKETYRATVFGYETILNVDCFDSLRERLYYKLNELIPCYFKDFGSSTRVEIFNEVEKIFSEAITDTCRPANDIPLWQHAYVTAALCKVFFLHFLIYGENLPSLSICREKNFFDAKFALYGFGWDGLSFISKGHKIGDIIARKQIVHNLKESIKEIVEHKYPIGINIYDDDNGISFIIPAILDSDSKEYGELLEEIERETIDSANHITGGEILPVSARVKSTHFVMEIVSILENLRKESPFCFGINRDKPSWMDLWKKEGKEICSVCQKRPLARNKEVCEVCEKRRSLAQAYRGKRESVFSDEIADENGRLCLIVASFNLIPWLSGDMLWTLFVKEPQSLKNALLHLGKIKDFYEADEKRKKRIEKKLGSIENFKYIYENIKNHIDMCLKTTNENNEENEEDKEFVKGIGFLFHRHTNTENPDLPYKELNILKSEWLDKRINQEIKIDGMNIKNRFGKEADIYNYLLTKNHTPSRLLNVWNGTREFLRGLFEAKGVKKILPPFRRLEVEFDTSATFLMSLDKACYEATIAGERVELIREEDRIFIINHGGKEVEIEKKKNWMGKEATIYPSEFEKRGGKEEKKATVKNVSYGEEYFYPYRVITVSPDLLMAFVPANKIMEINQFIYQQYISHFGKVVGRLSFSIGNVFFRKKTPMFVVLDAGKRMAKSFEELYKEYWKNNGKVNILEVKDVGKDEKDKTKNIIFKNDLEWKLNQHNGDGNIDYFHPYFIVKCSKNDTHRNRLTYFKTFLGELVHFSEIERGDQIRVYPNFYDFEFLDSTTRRYDIAIKGTKRKSTIASFFSKPYLLDELEQVIAKLWKKIKDGELMPEISDTKLRNIEFLWLSKLNEWGKGEQWRNLIETTLKKEFPKYKDLTEPEIKRDFEWLKNTIFSGLFFDCLELNLTILKNRIKEEEGGI